jgi:hypothetical protein
MMKCTFGIAAACLQTAVVLLSVPANAQSTLGHVSDPQRAARIDIEALNAEFTYQLDSGHHEVLADFFTEDGSLGAAGAERAVGRAAIAKRYASRPAGRTTHHVSTNLRLVFESPTRVHGTRTLTYYAADGTPSKAATPLGVADYTETYQLGADGAWRYVSRTVTPVFGLNVTDKPVAATK